MNQEIRIFSIYVSGILYGKLKIGDGEPSLRSLDVFSGTLRDWKPLSGEENAFYQSFLKMDLAKTAEKIGRYESQL